MDTHARSHRAIRGDSITSRLGVGKTGKQGWERMGWTKMRMVCAAAHDRGPSAASASTAAIRADAAMLVMLVLPWAPLEGEGEGAGGVGVGVGVGEALGKGQGAAVAAAG